MGAEEMDSIIPKRFQNNIRLLMGIAKSKDNYSLENRYSDGTFGTETRDNKKKVGKNAKTTPTKDGNNVKKGSGKKTENKEDGKEDGKEENKDDTPWYKNGYYWGIAILILVVVGGGLFFWN